MQAILLKPEEIDIDKIHIDKLKSKKYSSGQESKKCNITYDCGPIEGKKLLYVRLPVTFAPFGVSTGKETEGEAPSKIKKYVIDFNLSGSTDIIKFKEFIQKLDEKNIDFILGESATWWGKTSSGKPYTRDTIADACYTSMIKKTAEDKGDYPDRFRIKLNFYQNEPKFKVYNIKNEKINWVTQKNVGEYELDWSWATKNMKFEAIIAAEALWEVNKKVYCTFTTQQIRVHPTQQFPECAFDDVEVSLSNININTEDKVNTENKVNTEDKVNTENKVNTVVDDDSNDEEDDDAGDEVLVNDDEEEEE